MNFTDKLARAFSFAVFSCLSVITTASAGEAVQPALYPGERLIHGGGYPALTKFIKGDPEKPLVVFIPGAGHTARIAYGGHPGAHAEDFLAHWLVVEGYNFVGISYPITTTSPTFSESHPEFTIRSWGKQAAEIAKATVEENKLSKKVILVVWSNGGRIPQSFNEAAKLLDLQVEFCTSLSATPPTLAINTFPPDSPSFLLKFSKASNGYIDLSRRFDDWYSAVKSNSAMNEGREIIPRDVFHQDYVGNMPVNLTGLGIKYQDKAFKASGMFFIEDSKAYDLADFPLMTTIITTNVNDARHAITDQAVWAPFLMAKVYADYIKKQ